MAYEYWLMQALAHGDMERVRAIQRLNSVGSYSNGNQRIDDEVLAVHGII